MAAVNVARPRRWYGALVSSGFVQQMLAGHSALGLALGGLIYLVCLTGTLDVFVAEFRAWEQPHPGVTVTPEFLDTALEQAQQHTPIGSYFYLMLPSMEAGRARLETGGSSATSYVVAADGQLGPKLLTPFTDFLDRTHMYLCLPQTAGLITVGLIGTALLSLLMSGVLAHPRIFRDAFTLRWGGSRRLQEADMHNRLSVWGLPFHLAVVLTGVFFGLSNLLVATIATSAYHGDTSRIEALLEGPSTVVDPRRAAAPALGPMLSRLGITGHLDRLNYIGIQNVGTRGAQIRFEVRVPGRLLRGESESFDVDGRYLGAAGFATGPGGKQVYAASAALHFGSFGGLPVRLAYGFLGLALCVVSASGITIWAARRRDQGRPMPEAERLWLGTVWGLPTALAATAVASLTTRMAPVAVFWSVVLIMLMTALTRKDAGSASRASRFALMICLAGVAVVHGVKFGIPPAMAIDAAALIAAMLLAVSLYGGGRWCRV